MILLTGATGSVGRHIAADLIAKGLDVRVVVRDPETAGLPAGVEVVRGDLVDSGSLSTDQIRIGAVRGPYGEAARSLIDERDIAAVAVSALTEGGHAGKTYVLSGPATVTQAEQARIIGEAIGRPVIWEEQSRADARLDMVALFGEFADGALDTWAGFVKRPERVTATVEEITGVTARSFRQWATAHAEDFQVPNRSVET